MTAPINTHRPRPGDHVRIGAEVALRIDPAERWARVVGILHRDVHGDDWQPKDGPRLPFIVRVFKPGDVDFPTGEYRRTSMIGMCPISDYQEAPH